MGGDQSKVTNYFTSFSVDPVMYFHAYPPPMSKKKETRHINVGASIGKRHKKKLNLVAHSVWNRLPTEIW